MPTWGEARAAATTRLRSAPNPDTAALDADVLLAYVLGVGKEALFAHPERELSAADDGKFQALVERRGRGEPVAYLRGFKEFYGLRFLVDPRVLIPRPETEVLVEIVLKVIRAKLSSRTRLLDVGTGSGVLAITFAFECPNLQIVGSDVSRSALNLARENAESQGLNGRIEWVESDLLSSVAGPFDFLVANLPYIPTAELPKLAPEVKRDPQLALDGGPDGLVVIRRLLRELPKALRDGAFVILALGLFLCERYYRIKSNSIRTSPAGPPGAVPS